MKQSKIYSIYYLSPSLKHPRGKVGCTNNIPLRMSQQGYTVYDCIIIETYTDIEKASLREQILQIERTGDNDGLLYGTEYGHDFLSSEAEDRILYQVWKHKAFPKVSKRPKKGKRF